jgi:integrase
MRFPKRIRHRRAEAVIYGKSKAYPFYRLAYRVNGRRRMASFATYSEAKGEAEKKVRELAGGSQVAALSAAQARDALAALDRLGDFRRQTGRSVSLLRAVSLFCDAEGRLNGRSLGEAVDGFLANVATVKRKDVAEAVEEYLAERMARPVPKNRRPPSPVYEANLAAWLREFAGTFPATGVSDLTRDFLNLYMQTRAELAAKSRNDRRAAVKMFLGWCVTRDYLSPPHRLLEASSMKREDADVEEIDFHRPAELQAMLDNADPELRPMIAMGGLAGLRMEELLRMTWADVWRVPGHVEVTARLAKTRARRLVEIRPALAQWLEPYRARSAGPVWTGSRDGFFAALASLRESLEIPSRRNGLRHSFISFSHALHGENLTSVEAGTSPDMIHSHYKGLATKAEAEKWFNVMPTRAENVIPLSAVSPKGAH